MNMNVVVNDTVTIADLNHMHGQRPRGAPAFCRQHWMDPFDDEEDDAGIPADEADAIRKFFAAAEGQASWELTQAFIGP
jgi:hypothetical protein